MSVPGLLRVEHLGAFATARLEPAGWEVDVHAGTGRLDVAAGTHLLEMLSEAIAVDGGGVARWRVPTATAEHRRIALGAGYGGDRRLWQMRRPLPLPWASELETRPFQPGIDDEGWLRVNNAAFAWHPEQGGWTMAQLHQHMAESWFDPEGFLVHPPSGPIQAFCWTKVHSYIDPPLGEIFIIGVDPSATGQGLGRGMVLAGLGHLAERGVTTAMLYTESDNIPAVTLYEQLGFTVHHEIVVFERTVVAQEGDARRSDAADS